MPDNIGWYDHISIKGEFTFYDSNYDGVKDTNEKWELKVVAGTTDEVLLVQDFTEPAYRTTSIAELLSDVTGNMQRDRMYVHLPWVTVTDPGRFGYGYGSDPSDYTYFFVKDNSSAEELEVFVGSNAERAEDINWDDMLDVYGIFTYYDDNDNGIYEEWETLEISIRADSDDKVTMRVDTYGDAPSYTTVTMSTLMQDPDAFLGKYIAVYDLKVTELGGFVYDSSKDPDRSVYFFAMDGTSSEPLNIYAEGTATRPLSLSYDDEIYAKGVFSWYDTTENGIKDPWEGWELIARKASTDAIVLEQQVDTVYTSYTLSQILQGIAANATNSNDFDNKGVYVTNVTIADPGRYAYLTPTDDPTGYTYFDISDDTTTDLMNVYCGYDSDKPYDISSDDTVSIWGVLKNDTEYGWEILVRSYSTDRVIITQFANPSYDTVTIDDLLSDPPGHFGDNVFLDDVYVTDPGRFGYGYGNNIEDYTYFYASDSSTWEDLEIFIGSYAPRER
jgi:hypothetical protein